MVDRLDRNVLVIGSHGVLGRLTVAAFEAAGWTVRRAARRPGPQEIRVDLDSVESVAAALRKSELVVNTVPHPELLPERWVLERGGALINTSALPAAAGRSLRAVAGGARGLVLMNAGIAPGVTNVVAADLLRKHPSADELEIVFTLSGAAPRGSAGADFVHRGLTAVPRHRTALIPLPDPFGDRICLGFAEGEAAWLGGVAEGRVVRHYICIAEPAAHDRMLALNGEGTMNELPRSLFKSQAPRRDGTPSMEPVAHWIAVKTGERRLAVRTVECNGDFAGAARSTVVFAETLITTPRRGGTFDPEEICTLSHLEAGLHAVGVTVVERPTWSESARHFTW